MSDEEGPALEDLMTMLAGDLEVVIAQTLAHRSPEPARGFGARVAATDRLVAAQPAPATGRHPALGVTAACLILIGWLAEARAHGNPDASVVLQAVHADLGPECAALAREAAAVLDAVGPGNAVPPRRTTELDEEQLLALLWLAAGMVRRYGDDDVAWLCGDPAGVP